MKNVFTGSFLILLFSSNLWAQKNTLKIQVGYGIPISNSNVLQYHQSILGLTNNSLVTVSGSFGKGLYLDGSYGYLISSKMSIQFDLSYLNGEEYNSGSHTMFSQFIEFSPLGKFYFGSNKIKAFAALGPVIGFGNIYENQEITVSGFSTLEVNKVSYNYKGSISVGAKGILGLEYPLNDKIGISTQLTVVTLSYAPSESEITRYSLNGIDKLSTLSTYFRQTEFKETLDILNVPSVSLDRPNQSKQIYFPMNSLIFSFGLFYKF